MKTWTVLSALTLAAALSACGSGNTPIIDPVEVTTISGHISAGNGVGNVTLPGADGQPLAQTSVDEAGNFTLNLPPVSTNLVSTEQVMSVVGCTGTLNSSNTAAKGYGVAGLKLSRGTTNDVVLPMSVTISRFAGVPTGGSFDGRVWVYADQATTLSGSVDCTALLKAGIPVNINVKASVVPGWNMLRLSGSAALSLNGVSINGELNNTNTVWKEWKTLTELKAALTF